MTRSSPVGPQIERLIKLLGRLPGLGPRSARRTVLHLLKNRTALMEPLIEALQEVAQTIVACSTCGNLDTSSPCSICSDTQRQSSTLVVVKDVSDLWALERAQAFLAPYHVLGGVLSPLDGIGPEKLNLDALLKRIAGGDVQEVILALDATVEGQSTVHYITDLLRSTPVKVSRLAHGVPVGGELDYLDDGTLMTAFRQRVAVG